MLQLRSLAGPLRHFLHGLRTASSTPELASAECRVASAVCAHIQIRHKKSQPRIVVDAPEQESGLRDDMAIREYTRELRESGMQRALKDRAFYIKPNQQRRKERSDTTYRIQTQELRRLIKLAMARKER